MILGPLAAIAGATAGEARACNYTTSGREIGPKRTPSEIREGEARLARERLRLATLAAQRRLAEGTDASAALADMLVPNVRAIYIETSSCGDGEIDWAGSDDSPYAPLTGTPYAGREAEFRPIVVDWGPGTLGNVCNAEFRGRFAAWLRRRLPPEQLKQSFVFLTARHPGGALRRLMAFDRMGRRPPVHWIGNGQIDDWIRRHPVGRALSAKIAAFWSENAPLLESSRTTCPEAFADWQEGQADLVARIEDALKPH